MPQTTRVLIREGCAFAHLKNGYFDHGLEDYEWGPVWVDATEDELEINRQAIDWLGMAQDTPPVLDTSISETSNEPAKEIPEDLEALLDWNPPAIPSDWETNYWERQAALTHRVHGTLRDYLQRTGLLSGDSWRYWRAYLYGLLGEPMSQSEYQDFHAVTGRLAPAHPIKEGLAVAGRRCGKTQSHAVLATYLASLDWGLPPGERAVIAVVAWDRDQASTIYDRCAGIAEHTPAVKKLLESKSGDKLDFSTGTRIQVLTRSFRGLRGYTLCAFIGDEASFWYDEKRYANPIEEVIEAARPGLGTLDGWLLLCTSPYVRQGYIHDQVERNHGSDTPVAVLRGPTHVLNSNFTREYILRQFQTSPRVDKLKAEWLGLFRGQTEGFVPQELVDRATDEGTELREFDSEITYRAFLDPSGGVSDSMTLAIAHKDGDHAVLDLVLEVEPPFSPREVVADFARVLRGFDLYECVSDRVGGVWVAQLFEEEGIVVRADAQPKSTIYAELLPLLSSARVRLVDDATLRKQLLGLERRPTAAGREVIDHAAGAHDDVVNAAAGALVLCFGEVEGSASWVK